MATERPVETETLGAAKVQPFGWCLRQAIKSEFGTSRALAERLGVTQGRISQVLSGQETISAVTLETLVSCFEDLGRQEALRQAWLDTFSPSTLDLIGPSEEEAEQLLTSIPNLIEAGRARQTLTSLERLHRLTTDQDLRFRLAKAIIDLLLFRGQAHQALTWSRQLIEQAQDAGEPGWLAMGLWTSATAGRVAPGIDSNRIVQLHERAVEFLGAWLPSSREGKAVWSSMSESICRDRALTLLAVHERRPISHQLLATSAEALDGFLDRELKTDTRAVFLEVKGRVQLARGDRVGCEELLEHMAEVGDVVSSDFAMKTAILQARLLIAQGKREQAEPLLEDALSQCFEVGALHHSFVIERLLTDF